jgi:hypothetical protein
VPLTMLAPSRAGFGEKVSGLDRLVTLDDLLGSVGR